MIKKYMITLLGIVLFAQGYTYAQAIIKYNIIQPELFEVVAPQLDYDIEDSTLLLGENITVTGGSGEYSYLWITKGEEVANTPTLLVTENGYYTVEISDGRCLYSLTFNVGVDGDIQEQTVAGIQVATLPERGRFSMKMPTNIGNYTLEVYTLSGTCVESFNSSKDNLTLNLSSQANGTYLIRCKQQTTTNVLRVIVH